METLAHPQVRSPEGFEEHHEAVSDRGRSVTDLDAGEGFDQPIRHRFLLRLRQRSPNQAHAHDGHLFSFTAGGNKWLRSDGKTKGKATKAVSMRIGAISRFVSGDRRPAPRNARE